ncbi:TlpA disulfide reductase family protein [uncultured Tenacibaculum sp.]|uniref:TlpA family protein disulfide reductase n=1 Tax=uncultured Tenacibaculum sp. TaxID=174713 RepID=UPI0026143AE9|nr:TlpA disulfide reductase family protein [uncultured Tenacibaculum sp.]
MRNIVPALLSIGIGFAISFFGLQSYSNSLSGKPVFAINETVDTQEETQLPEEEETTDTENTQQEISADINEETPSIEETIPEEDTHENIDEGEEAVEVKATTSTSYDSSNIQKSFDNWEAYTKDNIDLMSTFTPLDEKGATIEKGIFLTLLRTGAYIPIKSVKEEKIQYQLTNIESTSDEKIKKSITSKAAIAHQYFKMEGKKLPDYNFVDLEGKAHNKADTKGKLLVIKCWFITCKVCVEEFPELNDLVDKYKNEKIEFVSLAFDKKDELIEFLETKEFKYPTIPEQKDYMAKKLKVKQYPTHLIIDSNGVIIKMVNNVKTLTSELERIMGK